MCFDLPVTVFPGAPTQTDHLSTSFSHRVVSEPTDAGVVGGSTSVTKKVVTADVKVVVRPDGIPGG
eukprot:373092-Pleurochrysis_carterae.AAC.1